MLGQSFLFCSRTRPRPASNSARAAALALLACTASACQLTVGGNGSSELDTLDSSISTLDDEREPELEDARVRELDAGASKPDVKIQADAELADGSVDCAEPVLWYADEDQDGFGDPEQKRLSCGTPPRSAKESGDCADHDGRVHPRQASYFGEPYQSADGSASFDYDCSGAEEGMEGVPVAPASCGLLSLALCTGSGYAITARAGANILRVCGSKVRQTCQAAALGLLVCEAITEAVVEPYACH